MRGKELLEHLPFNCLIIAENGRIAKVEDGKVIEYKPDEDPTIVPNLVGGNQDPGGGEEGGG